MASYAYRFMSSHSRMQYWCRPFTNNKISWRARKHAEVASSSEQSSLGQRRQVQRRYI